MTILCDYQRGKHNQAMADCCEDKACEIDALRKRQGRVLSWVLIINAAMFAVEYTAGVLANSTALLADSLDMLGDALVYSFSLYVLVRDRKWQGFSALLKGLIMAGFGFYVLAEAGYKIVFPVIPQAETIGLIGALALLANVFCLTLLWTHRSDDINMRSVWLCSRNDVIANAGVLAAAAMVALTASRWPDIAIGLIIALLFLRSALHVIAGALRQLRSVNA